MVIVDDNADGAQMLAEALTLTGYEVHVELSSLRAAAALAAFAPDVALLDIGMPDLDGYELCTQIRSGAATRHLPLIALTGYGQPADRERAAEAGFDAHCIKPTRLAKLLELIESLVATGRIRSSDGSETRSA